MTKPAPATCRTTNWRAYNAALRSCGSLLIWFDPKMEWLVLPSGWRGRPATFSDAVIQACLTRDGRCLAWLCARRAGWWQACSIWPRLDWPVPDHSTLCRRQKDLTVTVPYRPSSGALHLPIGSTGIRAMGEGEWSTRKHGASRPRPWRKVHPGIDADTLEVRAIEGEQANATAPSAPANGSRVGDSPMLPKLLEQIPVDEPIGMVTADGAHDTRTSHAAIAARQACAVIAVRRNGQP